MFSEESGSSRKSSRRKSSHLTDILELADRIIPEQCYVECFIDPFTGGRNLYLLLVFSLAG